MAPIGEYGERGTEVKEEAAQRPGDTQFLACRACQSIELIVVPLRRAAG